ncbi:MAG: hypothetical protein L3J79_02885 [Candidatus Marinimicrobia bacterium]|nr:hypothetical protein [Candidatus Neomarinimicrobiota bacterium]
MVVSLLLLKAAISVTTVQQWTVVQGMSDSYMSREVARAKRVPYEDFLAAGSEWPVLGSETTQSVEIGRLPGVPLGKPVTGTLRRIRVPADNNLAESGTTITNPTGVEVWRLQSYLTYTVSGRDYVKSRTVLRVR